MSTVQDPATDRDDERIALEEERDFLLRSLDDLEAERAAGEVDHETYERLHADYTARAAAVLRTLRDGVDSRPVAPPVSTRRRVLTIGGIVAFAAIAAVVLAFGLGARLPGDTITGRSRSSTPGNGKAATKAQQQALEAAVTADPGSADAHRNLARFRLSQQDYPDALKEFDAAAKIAPNDAESRAYAGWILFLVSQSASGQQQQELRSASRARLDAAVQANAQYPDAHFFRGMVLFRGFDDPTAAVPELQQYLVLAPDGALAEQVRQVLADAVKQAGAKP
jgi:tetratricopeptide (TPR) repeat protein